MVFRILARPLAAPLALLVVLVAGLGAADPVGPGAASADLLAERDYEACLHRVIADAATTIDAAIYLVVLPADARSGQPVRRLLDALVAAQRRGVVVRVLFDAGAPPAQDGALDERPNLAAARYLRDAGVAVRWDEDQRMTHAKALCADGAVTIIGSGNWTVGGLRDNRELAVAVRSSGLGAQFAGFFTAAWACGHRVD